MPQDIRDSVKKYKEEKVDLSANHVNKFEALLEKELHGKKKTKINYKWLSIAATVALLVSICVQFYPSKSINETKKITKEISLGSISPEFETIEKYYKSSISLEISQLELTEENKEVIDDYLSKISELTKEYKLLTQELNTKGVNDFTINALISNLKLRLQLLQRLKKQLQQLKNLNKTQNENQII